MKRPRPRFNYNTLEGAYIDACHFGRDTHASIMGTSTDGKARIRETYRVTPYGTAHKVAHVVVKLVDTRPAGNTRATRP